MEPWASPAPWNAKGRTQGNTFCSGGEEILIRHGHRAYFDDMLFNPKVTSQDKLPLRLSGRFLMPHLDIPRTRFGGARLPALSSWLPGCWSLPILGSGGAKRRRRGTRAPARARAQERGRGRRRDAYWEMEFRPLRAPHTLNGLAWRRGLFFLTNKSRGSEVGTTRP